MSPPPQCSAYIIDERFPCIPVLKWDHMMTSPPMFCHVLCDPASSGSAVGGATKVLLGSQKSQEITLLQFSGWSARQVCVKCPWCFSVLFSTCACVCVCSGGRATATFSRGPPQALLRPGDSLKHLPVQIPHRLDLTSSRLSAPAAGTCVFRTSRRSAPENKPWWGQPWMTSPAVLTAAFYYSAADMWREQQQCYREIE